MENSTQKDVLGWRLEHQEIFILVLEDELVDKRILLLLVYNGLNILLLLTARPALNNLQSRVSVLFIVGKHEIIQSKLLLWVFEAIRVDRLVVLDLKVAVNRLCELNNGQVLLREHVGFRHTNGVVPRVFSQAVHQMLEF